MNEILHERKIRFHLEAQRGVESNKKIKQLMSCKPRRLKLRKEALTREGEVQ